MRIFLSYMVIILIALQSMLAVAYSPALHQEVQSKEAILEHFDNHEEKHHDSIELAQIALLEANSFSDDKHEHPSCDQSNHQNHCHHTSLVYLDLQSTISLPIQAMNQIQPFHTALVSRVSSPGFRPPIV